MFTIDNLGNRTNVNVKDGNDITYAVDALTNRYETVDGNALDYDAAGNLIVDKDGYNYEYDYENRIARIYRIDGANEVDVVKYNYDSLGRRINKEDCIADTNTLYYYSNKWQVLCEYDKNQSWSKTFVWGNYIDELLTRNASGIGMHNYIHDHLYSPVAMLNFVMGTVLERYEYDAYGNPTIMDASYNVRNSSNYGNNYLFTGRSVDILDTSSLKIQHNRNRSLDYYTGRWFSHDPVGYIDGMSLYEYVRNNPVILTDAIGGCASKTKCKCCCVDNLTIENVRNLNGSKWGHSFDAKANFSWKNSASPGNCTFQWLEKTNLPVVPRAKADEWYDIYAIFPQSPTFNPIRNPKSSNEIVITDVPALGISPGRNAKRKLDILIAVQSAKGCPCDNKEKTASVQQDLELKNGKGTHRSLTHSPGNIWKQTK